MTGLAVRRHVTCTTGTVEEYEETNIIIASIELTFFRRGRVMKISEIEIWGILTSLKYLFQVLLLSGSIGVIEPTTNLIRIFKTGIDYLIGIRF